MKVDYCDLCGLPVKEQDVWLLYLSSPANSEQQHSDYYALMNKIGKEVKELCPKCKEIFDRIFQLRVERLAELTAEIVNIYKTPCAEKKERKHGKEKA